MREYARAVLCLDRYLAKVCQGLAKPGRVAKPHSSLKIHLFGKIFSMFSFGRGKGWPIFRGAKNVRYVSFPEPFFFGNPLMHQNFVKKMTSRDEAGEAGAQNNAYILFVFLES